MFPIELWGASSGNRRRFGSGGRWFRRCSLLYGLRAKLGLCAFSYLRSLHARSALGYVSVTNDALPSAQDVERDSKKRLPVEFAACDASIRKKLYPYSNRKCGRTVSTLWIDSMGCTLDNTGAFTVGSGRVVSGVVDMLMLEQRLPFSHRGLLWCRLAWA